MKKILGFELTELALMAKEKEEENAIFLKYLRRKKNCNIDLTTHQLHLEITPLINCLECGNCCKALGPRLSLRDIENMAKDQRVSVDNFMQNYIRRDEDGDYIFKEMPCQFLHENNSCLVYDKRPKACREYPHTDQKRMLQYLDVTIKNTYYCPIAYLVVEGLKKRVEYGQKVKQYS